MLVRRVLVFYNLELELELVTVEIIKTIKVETGVGSLVSAVCCIPYRVGPGRRVLSA